MVSNKLAPIGAQPGDIKGWGKAIAKLTAVRDDNLLTFNCTGFLISPDLLITNRHCSESGSEARSISAQFDYDSPDSEPPPEAQVGVKELVLSSCDLDFAVLRLDRAVPFFPGDNRKPLKLGMPASVALNQQLLIIQHPGGDAKQVSQTGCLLTRDGMVGNSSMSTDFGHSCDTNKSSSGSPIQVIGSSADQNGKVIGIHHLGFRIDNTQADTPEALNRAVKINLILDFIKKVNPALAKELNIPL
jgi:V8-like Glu-specific endopeptidase